MADQKTTISFNLENMMLHEAKACADAIRGLLVAIEQDRANPGGNRVDMAVDYIEQKFTAAA